MFSARTNYIELKIKQKTNQIRMKTSASQNAESSLEASLEPPA